MPVTITSRFTDACGVVVANNYDTVGSLTRASVDFLNPSQVADIFTPGGLWAEMDAWFKTAIEMKACGIKTNGMYDWIMSGASKISSSLMNKVNVQKGPSLLQPFIFGKQLSVINNDFWAITCGAPQSGYTYNASVVACASPNTATGPLTAAQLALGVAADRVVRLVSRYGVELDAKWFLDRDNIHIFSKSGTGASQNGQWKVLAAAQDAAKAFVDVLITDMNSGTTTAYDTAPTSGVVVEGRNNVNDFESWCNNRPTLDPRKRVPFWIQTSRRTRTVDSEYEKVFARLMGSNDAFKEFGDLPLAERNRQDEEIDQRNFVNAFFFNKPISTNQTLLLWESLGTISTVTGATVDPGTGGYLIAKRANFIGVKEQLASCSRYKDLGGNVLNFYEFLDANYLIYRSRKSQGRTVKDIDWYTDSVYAATLCTAFMQYYKQESLEQFRITMELGMNKGDDWGFGFMWSSFLVKHPAGVRINIISHEYFDDLVSATANESIEAVGRMLLCLDLGKPGPKGGTIYWGQIASNRVVHTVGQIEELARIDNTFSCTMANITKEVTMTSDTGTVIVECPSNSLWIENLSGELPIMTGRTTPVDDLINA